MTVLSKVIIILVLSTLLLAGCATSSLERARAQFYYGNLPKASRSVEKMTFGEHNKDALLFLLESALIHHTSGEYEKSNVEFLRSAELAEQLEVIQPAREAASMLANDYLLSYKGASFERVLIHAYSAVNFLHLAQWEDAMVECKRALKQLDKSGDFSHRHPFTRYLSAMCYELMGDYDDAFIEYKKARDTLPRLDFVRDDLLRTAEMTGRRKIANYLKKNGAADSIRETEKNDKGRLVCFINIGKSPVKKSTTMFIGQGKWFTFPVYRKKRTFTAHAEIIVDGRYADRSYLFTDIEQLAIDTLKKKTINLIARQTARIIAREQVARKIEKKYEKTGKFSRFLFFLADKADTRSWQTLPSSLHIANIPVDAGAHEVAIRFVTRGGRISSEKYFGTIEVGKGTPVFLSARGF